VTSALSAITADLQKVKDAEPDLAPDRGQEVQDAATAFGAQPRDIVRQTAAGVLKSDPRDTGQERGRVAEVRRRGVAAGIQC
jgi:hypothetical protein